MTDAQDIIGRPSPWAPPTGGVVDDPEAIAERLRQFARFLKHTCDLFNQNRNQLSVEYRQNAPEGLPLDRFGRDGSEDDDGTAEEETLIRLNSKDDEDLVLRLTRLSEAARDSRGDVELCIGRGIPLGAPHRHPILFQAVESSTDPFSLDFEITGTSPVQVSTPLLELLRDPSKPQTAYEAVVRDRPSAESIADESQTEWLDRLSRLLGDGIFERDECWLFLRRRSDHYGEFAQRLSQAYGSRGAQHSALVPFLAEHASRLPVERWTGCDDDAARFPLGSNLEQSSILERLADGRCVSVQGPPGTGKTHTIINLLSHLLSQGRRVLVTSQKGNALDVLVDPKRMPEGLRDLCFLVLSRNAASRKRIREQLDQLDRRLKGHARPADHRRAEHAALLRELEEHTDARRLAIQQWASAAVAEQELHDTPFGRLTLEQLARHAIDGSAIPDVVRPQQPCPLSSDELRQLIGLVSSLPETDRARARAILAAPPLPPAPELAAMWSEISQLSARLASELTVVRDADRFATASSDALAATAQLLRSSIEWAKLSSAGWVQALAADTQRHPHRWTTFLQARRNDLQRAENLLAAVAGAAIVIPGGLDVSTVRTRLDAVANRKRTKRLLRALTSPSGGPIGHITIMGRTAQSWHEVDQLLDALEAHHLVGAVQAAWNAWPHELLGAPLASGEGLTGWRTAEALIEAASAAVTWMSTGHSTLRTQLTQLGLAAPGPTDVAQLRAVLGTVDVHRDVARLVALRRRSEVVDSAVRQWHNSNRHERAAGHLAACIEHRDASSLPAAVGEIERLRALTPSVERLDSLVSRLKDAAPLWCEALLSGGALEDDPASPWRRSQALSQLQAFGVHAPLPQMPASDARREVIEQLAELEAWEFAVQRVADDTVRRRLVLWADQLKSTNSAADDDALRESAEALQHLPAVIMPIDEVMRTFDPATSRFDVIIVDESSQCDIRSLGVLALADRAVVVGDHLQINPTVFVERRGLEEVSRTHLDGVPTAPVLRTARSLYSAAQVCTPPSHQVELQEHFRCAPEIIGFNNELSYAGRIKPLNLTPSLPQVIRRTRVNGRRERDVNEAEARAIADEVSDICGQSGPWAGIDTTSFTIGVIPTVSTGAKKYKKAIEDAIRDALADGFETERVNRKLRIGTAWEFQGDERDVVILSFVVDDEQRFQALTSESDRQRMNVAVSRASKSLVVVHSTDSNRFHEHDVRGLLLRYLERGHDPDHKHELHPMLLGRAEAWRRAEPACHLLGLDAVQGAKARAGVAVLDARRGSPAQRVERLARAAALLPELRIRRASAEVLRTHIGATDVPG